MYIENTRIIYFILSPINKNVIIIFWEGGQQLTVQQLVHLNRDRCLSANFFGASGLPGPPALREQQQNRRTMFGTTQTSQQQQSRRLSLPKNVSVGGMVGGAMPRALTESTELLPDEAGFFFRFTQPHHVHRRHHRCRWTPTALSSTAARANVADGRPLSDRFRSRQRPHNRGRRFHAVAQYFCERLSASVVAGVPLPELSRRRPPHNLLVNRL